MTWLVGKNLAQDQSQEDKCHTQRRAKKKQRQLSANHTPNTNNNFI